MLMQYDFQHLRREQSHFPTRMRSLASPSQGMGGMAWRGVAWYVMAWRDRSADVRCIADISCVFRKSSKRMIYHWFKFWEGGR